MNCEFFEQLQKFRIKSIQFCCSKLLIRKTDTFGRSTMCPSSDVRLIESTKRSEERKGPTLGVRFSEVSVKIEPINTKSRVAKDQMSVRTHLLTFFNRGQQ